ncbi:glycosyltransferase [Klebsiella pneumoniae]|uniref:glycosyltransferase n=1 Tax=Klebsiella pneumoniae TaxID=573 RepID=UPI0012BAA8A5|nr:glycosyltransferase [Klebsiella pneumoniae]HDS4696971.1 glycosyltransferase [Klebsiella pneumoniae subsp. pneumoniae]MBD7686624.1 glycosyltransferase [Klebsiella pneumoniae]MBG1932914.1 glycosyltransferase [Klebsiella pneumoniae]MTF47985.1 glycosyltransferase [Klebsiella pneumoniae]HBR7622234.1 glycosyltransferase [Klebsiella pneumoniae]
MEVKIAGVLVLYNPTHEVIDNINTYITHVNKLYLIDNSSNSDFGLLLANISDPHKISYISNKKNEGVAVAINRGAVLAQKDGYDWLLTMDQDSSFTNINEMLVHISQDQESHLVGLYSPFHDTGTRVIPEENISYVSSIMTSGNIINLRAFLKIGMADERFFIDCIDHDLCAKFIQEHYFIKRLNFCLLKHELGNDIKIIKGKEITNHSPFRRYYITRNTFYYCEKHFFKNPIGSLKYLKSFLGNTLSCFLYEDQKKEKLKFILKGLRDYFLRRTGAMTK